MNEDKYGVIVFSITVFARLRELFYLAKEEKNDNIKFELRTVYGV